MPAIRAPIPMPRWRRSQPASGSSAGPIRCWSMAQSGIIAGHGRVLAARKLGLERVPVIELAHMSEAQKRAYVLADNQLALNAGWDEALLRLELADLSELGFDLGLIGFGEGELERLLAGDGKAGLTEDDEAPALPEQAITQPGDLWVLGEHRLLCGDATVLARCRAGAGRPAGRHDLDRSALQRGLRQLAQGQAAGQAPADPERRSRRRLRGVPAAMPAPTSSRSPRARSTCACRHRSCTRCSGRSPRPAASGRRS